MSSFPPYAQEQLKFLIDLASHRPEWLNPFFSFLNLLDSVYFYYLVLAFVWVGISYRWGVRLFYILIGNYILNLWMKHLFQWERPSTLLPHIALSHPSSFAFPSGAAQAGLVLGGLLMAVNRKRPWVWVAAVCYIALMSFSRLYLGVHYPIDLLGGWVLGACVLALFFSTFRPIERWMARQPFLLCLVLAGSVSWVGSWLVPQVRGQMVSVFAFALGILLSYHYQLPLSPFPSLEEAARRASLAFGGLLLCALLCFALFPPWLTYTSMNLWLSLLFSPVYRTLDRRGFF